MDSFQGHYPADHRTAKELDSTKLEPRVSTFWVREPLRAAHRHSEAHPWGP